MPTGRRNLARCAVTAACLALCAPAGAQQADPRDQKIDALQQVVADLQKQVDQLKAANDDQWLTQQRADEVRGLVREVLADADTRASLLQSGVAAGWDNGFFVGSTDGNYLLKLSGQLQVRFVYNHQHESSTDNDRYGFEIRRAKIFFGGHVFDPSWQYEFELSASSNGGTFTLGENGWIQKTLGDVKLRFGQFKPLFTREENVSSRRLLAVERSQVNSEFTAGTAQGVQALYTQDRWRVAGSIIDGANTVNTNWSTEDNEYAFTGRFEFLAMGDWKSVEDDVGFRGMEQALLLGAAILFQEQESGTGINEQQNLTFTADASYKNSGWDLMGEFFYRNLSSDGPGSDLDQYGLVFTAGYFVNDDIELYLMYEWGSSDIAGESDLSIITVGFTRFYNKHNLKWQNDIGYGFNPVASVWASDGAGWRTDAPDEDGQIVIRSQFQLLF
jgi:hypothetical protein